MHLNEFESSLYIECFDNVSLNTNCTTDEELGDINIPPVWRQIMWTLLYSIIVIGATGGNLIVIWIVLAHKKMRTVTNYFLVNLSIADVMVSIFNVIFNYIYMLYRDWPFGTTYCKLTQFTAVLSICASVFTLVAISIDRYVAIMKPLRQRIGKRSTLVIIGLIWFFAAQFASPTLIFYTTEVVSYSDGYSRTLCFAMWPDGPAYYSQCEYVYSWFYMVFTFTLPVLSISFLYFKVGTKLWGYRHIGDSTFGQMRALQSKRKIIKMLIVVVTIFTICWLPYHIYFIMSSLWPEITTYYFIQETYLAIYWLAMSHSMYNPFIYIWMNRSFRHGFKNLLFQWCLNRRKH